MNIANHSYVSSERSMLKNVKKRKRATAPDAKHAPVLYEDARATTDLVCYNHYVPNLTDMGHYMIEPRKFLTPKDEGSTWEAVRHTPTTIESLANKAKKTMTFGLSRSKRTTK